MAMFRKAVALGLLVALGLALQGRRAEAQGNGRDKVRSNAARFMHGHTRCVHLNVTRRHILKILNFGALVNTINDARFK